MIEFLKSKGYKFTTSETLNNRQFRHVQTSLTPSEEESTFENVVYTDISEYELFLDEKYFNQQIVIDTLEETRAENMDVTAVIQTVETGRVITFTMEKT